MRLSRRATPYLLLAPGLAWLAVFFLVPMYYLANTSLQTGSIDVGYTFSWAWSNYKDALTSYDTQFLRSVQYAAIATIAALLISYPLAYWIAFRGGRWRNVAQLVGWPHQYRIGNVIQSMCLAISDSPAAVALSFVLMAAILLGVIAYARVLGSERLTG